MRIILLASIVLLVSGCGRRAGPVTATVGLEAKQRENEAHVHDSESAWQRRATTGNQEQEAKQREDDERVHEAESALQKHR